MKMWQQGGDARQRLSPGLHMTDAAAAGALTLMVTNPVWVAKTQVMLAYSAHAGERTALRPEHTKVRMPPCKPQSIYIYIYINS